MASPEALKKVDEKTYDQRKQHEPMPLLITLTKW